MFHWVSSWGKRKKRKTDDKISVSPLRTGFHSASRKRSYKAEDYEGSQPGSLQKIERTP